MSRSNNKQKQSKSYKKRNTKSRSYKKKRNTRKSRSNKRNKQKGGQCTHLKVYGLNLPDLKIPDQMARIGECQDVPQATNHPHMISK